MPYEREEAARAAAAESTRIHRLGSYRLLAELARGGMSTVYLAVALGHADSRKLLVLKELKPDLSEDRRILSMFIEEARLAASLNHPNVVRTLDAGSDRNRHYIVMEFLDGQSLYRVLNRGRKQAVAVPLEWQGSVLCSALEGLAYAHAASDAQGKALGIVHRDMSPQNVFVGYDGQVKVIDFGIAKAAQSSVDTHGGTLKGKLPYMSPQQAIGEPVDARTDVFAVGVMLWEAVTGHRFWSELEGDVQVFHALTQGRLPNDFESAMADVPRALRSVVIKATSPDPTGRHVNGAELLADLGFALASAGIRRLEPQEVGLFVRHLFAEDQARLQTAIENALASRGPRSGEFLVSCPEPGDTRASVDTATTARPPPEIPDLSPASASWVPSAKATARARDELLAESDEIARAAQSLRESERIATLPASVQAVVRALKAAGGQDGAAAFEALANCMDIVERLDEWRVHAVEYLQSSAREMPIVSSSPLAPTPATTGAVSAPASPTAPPIIANPSIGPSGSVAPVAAVDGPPPAARARAPLNLPVAAAALGALLATIGLSVLGRIPAPPVESAKAPPASAVPSTAAPQERPPPEKAHVIVRVSPASARIVVDRDIVYENPCILAFAKDGAIHSLHAEAEGYIPRDEAFEASGDATFVLTLEPRKGAAPPPDSRPHAATLSPPSEPKHLLHPSSLFPTSHDDNP